MNFYNMHTECNYICIFLAQSVQERGMNEFEGTQENLGVDRNISLIVLLVKYMCTVFKTHQNVHLTCMKFYCAYISPQF